MQAAHAAIARVSSATTAATAAAAAASQHRRRADQCAAGSDAFEETLQEVYEAAIAGVTEAIEYDPDVDMSALDQAKASKCDLNSRIHYTLKYALPAALEARDRAQTAV